MKTMKLCSFIDHHLFLKKMVVLPLQSLCLQEVVVQVHQLVHHPEDEFSSLGLFES